MKMKRCLTLMLALVLALSLGAAAFAAEEPYADVPEGAWYADAVYALREKGLMIGVGEDRFDPDGVFTRAQLATVLYRMAGSPAVSGEDTFADTEPGQWYSDAVLWANQNEIVDGCGDGRFGTADAATQEQLALMLWRSAGAYVLGAEYDDPDGSEHAASDWAVDAVRWARVDGLLTDAVPSAPTEPVSRALAADMMYRYLQLLERFSDVDAVSSATKQSGALETIRSRGVLRVGTAGDYQPMSYLDPATQRYVGFDAELAEDLAAALGVEIEYVKTSWPTLMDDTLAGAFDLAICGITITEARQEQALMSVGYLENGKTVLCRAEDADKYTTLEAIDRPEVRVMENPGGLNEKFARANLPHATLIIHDVNQEIPGLVAAGEADVMITEIMEAGFYVGQDSRLAAPLIHAPFTHGQLGVLMPKGSEDLLDFVNAFLETEQAVGRIDELADKFIYRTSEAGALSPAA